MGRLPVVLGVILATTIADEACAKRASPKPVAPVVHNGVKFVAPNDNGREGKVEARNEKTGERLWDAVVYTVEIDPNLEEDVQWVFITGLALHENALLVTNEKNERFTLDLKTRKARKALQAESRQPGLPMDVPVLVVAYFPVDGQRIDQRVTGDWGATLAETRQKTERQTKEVMAALREGSRYHGYRNENAKPSLSYSIVGTREFLEPLPTLPAVGGRVPMTDYRGIMERVGIREWVEKKGVKEVWLWGYHGGVLNLWESNMVGPYGDISNSNRDSKDMPVLAKTYTVYHYNYQRGTSEAVEDHMHQIEAVLNFVDGRDRTPSDQWDKLLFWGKFVGSDRTHKIVRPGCGWSHYPPNAERDYDWANKRYVESDIEDWRPDGSGRKKRLNCDRWGGASVKWFVYWMQNLPGADNGLVSAGRPLTNWWIFIGDFDEAMRRRVGLVGLVDARKASL